MAIVHVSFKSSSLAPPAAAHAQYLAREGQYEQRGGLEMLESGNMPQFAESDPMAFWVAADAHERANGRTYTEVQVALPRELDRDQRQELARETVRELLGDRFAYTMAVHTPLAKDNIDQPHMHLMFSERAVTEATREIEEERFFKRNGAKKDPAWHDRNKPEEVRQKWVEMMNGAMRKAGIEQQLDARSWAEQGREDLASLREEKTLRGNGLEATERNQEIDALRSLRAELPAPQLDQAAAIAKVEQLGERQVAVVEERAAQELSRLDKLIAAAREIAVEVKERAAAVTQSVTDRMEQFLGRFERWREGQSEVKPEQRLDTQPPSRAPNQQEQKRVGPELGLEPEIEGKNRAFMKRYETQQRSLEPAVAGPAPVVVPEPPAKQAAVEKEPEQERKIERDHGFGFGR